MKELLEASHAIAEAVKAVRPDVIAAYPITPQTHVVEKLSDFVADGELKSKCHDGSHPTGRRAGRQVAVVYGRWKQLDAGS